MAHIIYNKKLIFASDNRYYSLVIIIMNITNSFLFEVINGHDKFNTIEKHILANCITCKNYIKFDVYDVNSLKEYIGIAEKYKLNYRTSSFPSKGGGTYYIITLYFPDCQSDDNEIQNFYFLNKKRYNIYSSNKINKHFEIAKKFTLIYGNYETSIFDLDMKDLIYIDAQIIKLSRVIENNKIKIPREYMEDAPVIECKEFGNDIYQKNIDLVAAKLYSELLFNRNIDYIKFDAYGSDNLDSDKYINMLNSLLDDRYIFSKVKNFNFGDMYDPEYVYLLKKMHQGQL